MMNRELILPPRFKQEKQYASMMLGPGLLEGVGGGGGFPNEEGNLRLSDGTFLSTRAYQVGFTCSISFIFYRDGEFVVNVSHPGTADWRPTDEYYIPGVTADIGASYLVRLASVSGDPLTVLEAPIGTWVSPYLGGGGTTAYVAWAFSTTVQGTKATEVTFEMKNGDLTWTEYVSCTLTCQLSFL